MDAIHVTREKVGEIEIFHISGKLDVNTTSELEKNLQDAIHSGSTKLILDLKELEYISSAGIKVFLKVHKKLDSMKGDVVITSINKKIREIFSVSGLDNYFVLTDNENEAIKALNNKRVS